MTVRGEGDAPSLPLVKAVSSSHGLAEPLGRTLG
jgi:hypothetical protein